MMAFGFYVTEQFLNTNKKKSPPGDKIPQRLS
jgi:hypothetical protein